MGENGEVFWRGGGEGVFRLGEDLVNVWSSGLRIWSMSERSRQYPIYGYEELVNAWSSVMKIWLMSGLYNYEDLVNVWSSAIGVWSSNMRIGLMSGH